MFKNIEILLLETSHPGNIGAAARAMKVMGLNSLSLVKPKELPNNDSYALAVGCKDVIKRAKIYDNLQDALEKSEINIGFSSRKRRAKIPILNIDECIKFIFRHSNRNISILFGNEQSGLSNEDLLMCNYIVKLPTYKEYQSLNLASAVQIFSYELFKHSSKNIQPSLRKIKLAPTKQKNLFYKEFINLLISTGFITKKNIKSLSQKIHIIFNKASLDKDEINMLLGIISSFNRKIKK